MNSDDVFEYVQKKFPGYGLYTYVLLKNGKYYYTLYYDKNDDFSAKSILVDPNTRKIESFDWLDLMDMDPETAKGYQPVE